MDAPNTNQCHVDEQPRSALAAGVWWPGSLGVCVAPGVYRNEAWTWGRLGGDWDEYPTYAKVLSVSSLTDLRNTLADGWLRLARARQGSE
jgi:hypothetical protein